MDHPVSTFSIGARDPHNGDLGIAVASRYLAVGSLVPHARADVGLVITQSSAYRPHVEQGFGWLSRGMNPEKIVSRLLINDSETEIRQFAVLDHQGNGAVYTGPACRPWAGHRQGNNYLCLGNMLAGEEVLEALEVGFLSAPGPLWQRLLQGLVAAELAGGDKRGRQAAALLVVRSKGGYGGYSDRLIDLRVDDHPQPVGELKRILGVWQQSYARIRTFPAGDE